MPKVKVTKVQSTFVVSTRPNTTYATSSVISLASLTGAVKPLNGGDRYGLLAFPAMSPRGSTGVKTVLTLTVKATTQAAATIKAQAIVPAWDVARVRFKDRPAVRATPAVTVVVPNGTKAGAKVSIDITPLVGPFLSGALWYGVQLSATSFVEFHSEASATVGSRPVVDVEWSDKPNRPTGMTPAEGVISKPSPILSWDWADYGGDRTMSQLQVQIATDPAFATVVHFSGKVAASAPEYRPDWSATPGVTYYWRASQADGAGLWSGWGAAASFVYQGFGAATYPGLTDGGTFTDPTPTIVATMVGMTAWRVEVWHGGSFLWSTGWVDGREVDVEIPKGVIKRDDWIYTIKVHTTDGLNRTRITGALEFLSRTFDMRFDDDAPIERPKRFKVTPLSPRPGFRVTWDRDSPADRFALARDGVLIDVFEAEDVNTGGGTYGYSDYTAPAGEHYYTIRAIENGRSSGAQARVTAVSDVGGRWLILPDRRQVPIFNIDGPGDHGLELREKSEEIELADGSIAVVTIGLRGYAGTVEGVVRDAIRGFGSMTLEECEDALRDLRKTRRARLVFADLNIPVIVKDINIQRRHPSSTRSSAVTMRVIQAGEEQEMGLLAGGWAS